MSEDADPQDAEDTTEESTEEQTEESTEEETPRKTILYAKTRAALRAEDLREIRDALPDEYSLVPSDDGSKIMIQREQEEDKSDVVADVLA